MENSSKISVSQKVSKNGVEILINWGDEEAGMPRTETALESTTKTYSKKLRELVIAEYQALQAEFNKLVAPQVQQNLQNAFPAQNSAIPCCPVDASHGNMKLNKAQTYWNCTLAKMVQINGKWENQGCTGKKKV